MAGVGKGKPRYRMHFGDQPGGAGRLCPACGGLMRQRQRTFAVHLPPEETVGVCVLCRYCQACDLLEVPWESLESRLGAGTVLTRPEVTGRPYVVLGTVAEPGAGGPSGYRLPAEIVPDVLREFREVIQPASRRCPQQV
jgi:hypothetical protein